ncbi:MAG: bacteriophage abortive infection AbiH family protein [Synergistaceae bacterium]|nr:bacteriophage abortive infection AbiH family protein [Synergistaceae bacterium]
MSFLYPRRRNSGKLFIIGNGFDLAHGLSTKYIDFYNYLCKTYKVAYVEEDRIVPEGSSDKDGDIVYDRTEVVEYIVNLLFRTIDVNWNNFEETLGNLDFYPDFDYLEQLFDKEGDRDWWHEGTNNEQLASELSNCVYIIGDLFEEWINTIKTFAVKQITKFADLISIQDDYFLNFNYTRTLENVYGVTNVCHIHGIQGERLLFGHGAKRHFYDDIENKYMGSEAGLELLHGLLRKDTREAIRENEDFSRKLKDGFSAVYSYGFSFGRVDQIYLKKIFKNTDTEGIVWYLHVHDESSHECQKNIIKKSGFAGTFDIFEV